MKLTQETLDEIKETDPIILATYKAMAAKNAKAIKTDLKEIDEDPKTDEKNAIALDRVSNPTLLQEWDLTKKF